MNRFVNILMIIVLVTCPFRCMIQGCGCYGSAELTQSSAEMDSCCCAKESSPVNQDELPTKCCGKCFCSGVITVDCFEINSDQSWQPLVLQIDNYGAHHLSMVLCCRPEIPLNQSATNQGREIRCLINSFVI